MQNGVRLANRDQPARELAKAAALGSDILPVEPVYRVVLRVGVVVAALGMAEFVAGQDHGRPLGEQKRRQEIALLARAQLLDLGIVGGSLHAMVPGMIVGVTVAIVFAISFVVLVVVRDKIVEVEAIMRGDEIHARPGPAPALVEEVART